MAYFPGQYGQYSQPTATGAATGYNNPHQVTSNYTQYGAYSSSGTGVTTTSTITATVASSFGYQPSPVVSTTPPQTSVQTFPSQSFYGYPNASTSTTNQPGIQNFANLWYNQTTANTGSGVAQTTAQQQSSQTTRQQQQQQQMAALHAQFYHQAFMQQQHQYQQQQQQLTNSVAAPTSTPQPYKSPIGAKSSPQTSLNQSSVATSWGNTNTQRNQNESYPIMSIPLPNQQQSDVGNRGMGWGSTFTPQPHPPPPQQPQQGKDWTQQNPTFQQPNVTRGAYGTAGGDYNWNQPSPQQAQINIQRQPPVYTSQPKNTNFPNNSPQYQQQRGQSIDNRGFTNQPIDPSTLAPDARASWGRNSSQNNWSDSWNKDQGWGDWNVPRNQPRLNEEGPNIPPFPEAWQMGRQPPGQNGNWDERNRANWNQHGFDQNGTRQNVGNRFARGDNQNRFPDNGRYSPNSRQSRGEKTDRELWSPADNKKKIGARLPKQRDFFKEEDQDKLMQATEIKAFLCAWLGFRHMHPVYDLHSSGDKPDQTFRCELRIQGYKFVGIGEASSKKESQSEAAWNFADFLVKQGEINPSELPPRSKVDEDLAENFGVVKDDEFEKIEIQPKKVGGNNQFHRKNQVHMNMKGGKPNIPPLMSLVTAPVGHPHMPPYMDRGCGPPEMWGMPPPHLPRMGPWMMGPPPPMPGPWRGGMGIPRGGPGGWYPNNNYWRLEEQWMEEIHQSQEYQHPEDIFINQMIMRHKEATMGLVGGGGMRLRPNVPMPMDGRPGDWQPHKIRNQLTMDDRHIMAKHAAIYPHEEELKSVHELVTIAEQALKALSDQFVDEDHPLPKTAEEIEEEKAEKDSQSDKQEEDGEDEKNGSGDEDKTEKKAKIQILKRPKKQQKKMVDTRPRILCAVNRVGTLAKGLLIHNDPNVSLVLLCGAIPTKELLQRILKHLPEKLKEADKNLEYELIEGEAGFTIEAELEVKVRVNLTLSSTSLNKSKPKASASKEEEQQEEEAEKEETKEENGEQSEPTEEKIGEENEEAEGSEETSETKEDTDDVEEPEGMLPKPLLLDALAELRHAKWFQARASQQDCCVVMIRILRDLKLREKVWSPLSTWAIENLVYTALSSSTEHMGHGDAFRRVFEVLAGGVLLPDRPGVQDPCEKEKVDVLSCCTDQQLEEITKTSQYALLKIAFRQIHQVLGMERLSLNTPRPHTFPPNDNFTRNHVEEVKLDEPRADPLEGFTVTKDDKVLQEGNDLVTSDEVTTKEIETQEKLADLTVTETVTSRDSPNGTIEESQKTSDDGEGKTDETLDVEKNDPEIQAQIAQSEPDAVECKEEPLVVNEPTLPVAEEQNADAAS